MIYFVTNTLIEKASNEYKLASLNELELFLMDKTSINLDTETNGLNFLENDMLSIQLGNHVDQYVIDVKNGIPKVVKDCIESRTVLKYLANAVFDYKFLLKYNIVMENVYDVLIADRLLYNGKKRWAKNSPNGYRFRLKDVMLRHLNIEMDKEAQSSFIGMTHHEMTEEQVVYAAKDVEHLEQIAIKQRKYINLSNMDNVCQLEMDNVLVNGDLSFTGIKVDITKWLSNEKWMQELVTGYNLLYRSSI